MSQSVFSTLTPVLPPCRWKSSNRPRRKCSIIKGRHVRDGISHRSKEFEAIVADAQNDLRDLLKIPANYKILFLQGGAACNSP